jgi:predicted metal-dependent phosphoesterase TrpH
MHNLPFGQPGRFWKGNLHTHSTASDGRLPPEEVCARYREAGYDFIALTDHFMRHYNFPLVDTRPYRTENFTTILGAELHTRNVMTEMGSVWHILAVGLPLGFAQTADDETAAQLASRALEAGAFVAVAHPNWYALTEKDFADLGQVDAVEVFNGTAVDHNDRMDSWHITDIMLGRGHRYTTCATDDFHGKLDRHDFTLGWVQVKSERLDPDALLAALKAGHYYSSTGPEIYDIRVTPGEKVYVRCSAADRIFLTGKASSSRTAFGNGITEAEFDVRTFGSPYCRVTVRDYHRGRAWSNPIWL